MISTIITQGTAAEREDRSRSLCEENGIHQYDRQVFSSLSNEEKGSGDEKFGIAAVRKIKRQAMLKPAYSTQNAIIILEGQLLTVPAQQALLKLLEEPPAHTSIILTADREDSFLPTIRSRCRVIRLADATQKEEDECESIEALLEEKELPIGRRLLLAESVIQNQPEEWVKTYILSARKRMLRAVESDDVSFLKKIIKSLTSAEEAHHMLSGTNVNQRLIVEQLFLTL